MKVSDIMHRSVITITEDMPLKEAGRLIFSLGIAGIPVVRGKKLIGIITEQDILSRMHPTMQELIEDYAHAKDFESMIRNMHGLLEVSVGKIMNPRVTSVTPDTPLMKAHSIMLLEKFSRLPIVNDKGELVGIISQGDVFRTIIKDEIPKIEKERYAGFISRYYDQMVNWHKRFDEEFPTLFKLLDDNKVKSVLDLGSWTGEYTVSLAKSSNYVVLGLDNNPIMINLSNNKKAKLPAKVRRRVSFALTDFTNTSRLTKQKFDALICMGNSLPYLPLKPSDVFKEISKIMSDKAIVVIQLLNFKKIMESKNRLLSVNFHKPTNKTEKERLSIEFFDHKSVSQLLHNIIIFDNDGVNWIYKGTTTIEVYNIQKEDVEKALRQAGFNKIYFSGNEGEYQGEYGKISFEKEFNPVKSDWLNVVAER